MADIPNFGALGGLSNLFSGGNVGGILGAFNMWFGKLQSMSQLDWFGLITVGLAIVNIILPIVFIMNDISSRRRMGQGR